MSEAPTLDNIVASKAAQDDFVRTRWWWIRHAPVRVDEGRIYGQRDLPCDCSDVRVFSALAAPLPRKAVWITSHLTRTRQTAQAILAAGDFEAPQANPARQGPRRAASRRLARARPAHVSHEPQAGAGLVLVCRRGRARAERRKLPRSGRAGRRRDRARERGSPGQATSSPSCMAERSARRWSLLSACRRAAGSVLRSTIARSRGSTIIRAGRAPDGACRWSISTLERRRQPAGAIARTERTDITYPSSLTYPANPL